MTSPTPIIPEWQTRLQARGILDAALEAGWHDYEYYGKPGWAFPLHKADGTPWLYADGQVVKRWKNFDSTRSPKTTFHPGMPEGTQKPDGCDYYWHGRGDMKARIANANGVLYLAAGEPDMLTLMQCGFYNVTSFFGEANIPDGFIHHMQQLGVLRIINYPDRDENKSGLAAAEKVHKELAGTGIDFTAYKLPGTQLDFDLNDYYNMPRPKALSFRQALVGLPPLTFAPAQKALPAAPDYDAFYHKIEAALGVTRYKDDGYSNPVRCLNKQHTHDDKKPAAGWHRDKHVLHCFKCETKMLGDEVALALGIELPKQSTPIHILPPPSQQPEPPPLRDEPPAQAEPAPIAPVPIFTMSEALTRYRERLSGKHISEFAPIPFPFKVLHPFGGFARIMKPRKMICVLGLSGGGKTSFLEGAGDNLRRNGIDILWWGPEWSWEEMADRAIQRYGGMTMTEMMLHETAISEAKNSGKAKFGELVAESDPRYVETLKILREIAQWSGEYYFVDQMRLDLSRLLDVMSNQIDKQRAAGRKLRVCMFDYVQLLTVSGARGDMERITSAVGLIKAFTADTNMNSFIATQPRKGDSESARNSDAQLISESAKYLEPNEFNLFITLTPEYREGTMTDRGRVSLTKNSMGRTGSIMVKTDLARLTWRDERIS